MVNEVMNFITDYDPEVGKAIEAEAARQRRNLELIASENIVSEPVMMAMGTVLHRLQTNMQRVIPGSGTTAAVSAWMWWRILPLTVQKSCLDATMPMYSPTLEHRLIWQCLSLC